MSQSATNLSLRSTRNFEPPYDDESGAGTALTDGALALSLQLSPAPTVAEVTSLRLLPGGQEEPPATRIPKPRRKPTATVPAARPDPFAEPLAVPVRVAERTSSRDLPPARAFSTRLVQSLSEADAGQRPLAHLAPHLADPVYDRLERTFAATVRGGGNTGHGNRASVCSVRVCQPADGVAEVAAVVRRGGRMAAIALRLEGLDGRWQCTALQIG